MSFDINWESLVSDAAVNEKLATFLNDQLSSITLPEYLSGLKVIKCELGDRAPEITVRNIDVPFPEFYKDVRQSKEESGDEYAESDTVVRHGTVSPCGQTPSDMVTGLGVTMESSISSLGGLHDTSSMSTTPLQSPSHLTPSVLPGFMNRGLLVSTPLSHPASGSFNYLSHHGHGVGISGSYFPSFASRSNSQFSSRQASPPPLPQHSEMSFDSPKSDPNSRSRTPEFNESFTNAETNEGVETKNQDVKDRDLQVIAEIKFDGDIYIEVTANLLVNFPAPNFISLPVRLKITDLQIHSIAVLAYLESRLYVSFLCDVEDNENEETGTGLNDAGSQTSTRHSSLAHMEPTPTVLTENATNRERIDIIKQLRIEGELGSYAEGQDPANAELALQNSHKEGSILRNIGKIEKFLVASIREILIRELAWPSWIMFDYNDDDDDDDEEESDEGEEIKG
ncbi:unnamed protein product [Kuraishia capsulata CBS 1993]|uniref:Mitochondrial distribution and morphology protein 12 n=1 Tax=Kuraishia capsulata CBS 1993 TaxID=1382522 RepID=W6MNG6_9ASCO|nr:uncharacterized protein KUCA_T00002549001 [Kuraishia capsulata CBS 1993]CDK26577.1 unnamed protein product [Kuraishia capsulata CBS 1993]